MRKCRIFILHMALTAYNIPGGKRKFVRTRHRWMKNMNMELNEEGRSVAGVVLDYCLDNRGIFVFAEGDEGFFSSPKSPDMLCGSTTLLLNRYWRFYPGVRRPGRETR